MIVIMIVLQQNSRQATSRNQWIRPKSKFSLALFKQADY